MKKNLIKKLAKKYNVSENEARKQIQEVIDELVKDYEIPKEKAEQIVDSAMIIESLLN